MDAVGSPFLERIKLANFRPVVAAALVFGTGIALGVLLGTAALFCILGTAAAIAALAAWKKRGRILLLTAALMAGCLRGFFALPAPVPEGMHELSGVVAEVPKGVTNGWSLTLRSVRIDGKPVAGNIRLYAFGMGAGAEYGDRLAVRARIERLSAPRNQGEADNRMYSLEKGVIATALSSGQAVRAPASSSDFYGLCLSLKESLSRNIRALFPSNDGLIEGILLGDTEGISQEDIAAFRDTGTAHLLAVSGLNISVFVVALAFLLRRVKPRWRILAIGAFLLVYCGMTGFAASIVRAAVMAMIFLIGSALGRRNDPPTSLAASGILILLVNPFELFGAGFQLSFAAVAAILMLYEPLMKLFRPLFLPLRQNAAVSMSAALGTLPIGMLLFHRIALVGLFANIIVVPVASVVMFMALGAVLAAYGSMTVAAPIAAAASLLIDGMRAVIRLFALVPGAVVTAALPGLLPGALFCALLFSVSKFCLLGAPKKRLLAGALGALFLASAILPGAFAPAFRAAVLARENSASVCVKSAGSWYLLVPGDDAKTLANFLAANGADCLRAAFAASAGDVRVVSELSRFVKVEKILLTGGDASAEAALGEFGLKWERFLPGSSAEIGENARVVYAGGLTLERGEWTMSVDGKTSAADVGIAARAKELSQPVRIFAQGAADDAPKNSARQYSTAEFGQIDLYDAGDILRIVPFVQPK